MEGMYKKNYTTQPHGIFPGMRGWFNIQKSIKCNSPHLQTKKKNCISIDAEEAFDKAEHPFIIKLPVNKK